MERKGGLKEQKFWNIKLCRPISRPAEREEEVMDVLADDVTAETAGAKSAIIKVNNTSRECRKVKIGFWNVAELDIKDAQF